MTFHEGQVVVLTADAPISDCAYITTGTSGYVEQVTTKRHHQTLMGLTIEVGGCDVVVLVHFSDQGLRVWVPQGILEEAGS